MIDTLDIMMSSRVHGTFDQYRASADEIIWEYIGIHRHAMGTYCHVAIDIAGHYVNIVMCMGISTESSANEIIWEYLIICQPIDAFLFVIISLMGK